MVERERRKKDKYTSEGKCRTCGKPKEENKCLNCSQKRASRRAEDLALDLCPECHEDNSNSKFKICDRCREGFKKRHKEYYQNTEYKEKSRLRSYRRRKKLKSLGLCIFCTKELDTSILKCKECSKKYSEYNKKLRFTKKESGTCIKCSNKALSGVSMCTICTLRTAARRNGFRSKDYKLLLEKLVEQNFKCYYTGRVLVLGINASVEHKNPRSRFPEEEGDIENIVWCDLDINRTKRSQTAEEFLQMCREVVNYNG